MNPELVGWQILTAFVILGGELCYWIDRWEARSYAKALPLIEAELNKYLSRTPGGSTKTTGRGDPAGATPGGQARVGFAAPLACPAGMDVGVPQTPNAFSRACRAQAPVDGSVPAHLPSTGPTPAGAAATPPAPALAGPPPWLRLAANRRQVCG